MTWLCCGISPSFIHICGTSEARRAAARTSAQNKAGIKEERYSADYVRYSMKERVDLLRIGLQAIEASMACPEWNSQLDV